MAQKLFFFLCAGLWGLAQAAVRTSPPAGCITVGVGRAFSTVQVAVNSLSTTSTAAQCIFIYPGTYKEQVTVNARAAQLTIYGSTTDTTSYAANTVTITQGHSQVDGLDNDGTATLRAHNVGMKVYNINLANSHGSGSQALALSAYQANKQSFYGVKLTGYQDTLLANDGNQLYVNSYIEGATDFIFGQQARAWFHNVTINTVAPGYITANGRDSDSNVSFYVFNKCTVIGTAAAGTQYLGRPWRDYSRVVFQQSSLSSVINPTGWHIWNVGAEQTDHVFYMEFANTGPGASGTRASFSGNLTSAETIGSIIGTDYATWVDTSYVVT